MTGAFLEGASRPLLVLHGLLGAAVLGAQTHHCIWALRSWNRRPFLARQTRLFGRVALALTATQVALGALLYPTYRLAVRARLFETVFGPGGYVFGHMTKLFDLKEHAAAACLAATFLAAALWHVRQTAALPERERVAFHRLVVIAATLLAWFAAIAGLYVTSAQGLGTVRAGL